MAANRCSTLGSLGEKKKERKEDKDRLTRAFIVHQSGDGVASAYILNFNGFTTIFFIVRGAHGDQELIV